MQSAFARSCWVLVAPPRPKLVPRPGTVAECRNTRLVLDLDRARRREELLDDVVLFVVEGRAAEAGDAERAADEPALRVGVLPALAPRLQEALRHHVHRGLEIELGPLRRVRRAVQHLLLALRARDELLARAALRAQPPARDRRVGVALDLHDLLVLDVHLLRAADGAVGADRVRDAIRRDGPGLQVAGARRLRRLPAAERVGTGQLAVDGPAVDPRPHSHGENLPQSVPFAPRHRPGPLPGGLPGSLPGSRTAPWARRTRAWIRHRRSLDRLGMVTESRHCSVASDTRAPCVGSFRSVQQSGGDA